MVYPGRHGTMVPGVPWYISHTPPGGNIPGCLPPPFPSIRLFPLGAVGVFSVELPGKHVFSGSQSVFYCVRRALPRDPAAGSRDSRIRHQTKRRVFLPLSTDPRNPENSHFLDIYRSGPHSNQRASETGFCRFRTHFRHLGTCAGKPAFLRFRKKLIRGVG